MGRKGIFNTIVIIVILSMLLIAALTGCSIPIALSPSGDEAGDHDKIQDLPSQNPLPEKGGQLRISISRQDELNPLLSKSKDYINLTGLIYEGLFSYDEDLNLVPGLAESWEVSDEGKLWRIQLRKGVKWHRGDEFTARDVKYTLDMILGGIKNIPEGDPEDSLAEDKEVFYGQSFFKNIRISRVELVINNPYAVDIVLDEPVGRELIGNLTFPILPKPDGEEEAQEFQDVISLRGTGPYKVVVGSLDTGGQVRLVRNEDWWSFSKPYINEIVVKVYENSEKALEAMEKGEVDITDAHTIYAKSFGEKGKIYAYPYLTQEFNFIGINHKSPGVLGDYRVRQAIAYGIDRGDLIPRIYSGNAQAVDVPIPSDAFYYNSDLRVYDYQPQKALQLLEDAGWKDSDGDGFLERILGSDGEIIRNDGADEDEEGGRAEGLSITITCFMDNILHKEALNLIKKQLAELGIELEIRLLPWDEYILALEEGDFQAIYIEYCQDLVTDLHYLFSSPDTKEEEKSAPKDSLPSVTEQAPSLNYYLNYKNEDLVDLLEEAREAEDPAKIKGIYKEIQMILVDELPIISLYYRTSSLIANERVRGIKNPRELMIYRNIKEWYLAK